MSFSDRQGIPEVLLWNHGVHDPEDTISEFPGTSRSDDAESIFDEDRGPDLEDGLRLLRDLTLISISEEWMLIIFQPTRAAGRPSLAPNSRQNGAL